LLITLVLLIDKIFPLLSLHSIIKFIDSNPILKLNL
jgi:hypothetical protein